MPSRLPMPPDSMRYVACYDVPDSRRRNQIARCLDDFGRRVQYSVFEMVLTRPLFDNMVERLEQLVDPDQDRLLIYPLCASCSRKVRRMGRSRSEPRPGDELVFIV